MNPSSVVIGSVVVITSTTLVRRMREGKGTVSVAEILVFGFLLMIALLVLAIVMPSVAKVLAYLGLVGAFVVNGPAVFKLLGDFGRGKGVV
jgi:hypothetical protein